MEIHIFFSIFAVNELAGKNDSGRDTDPTDGTGGTCDK
jgi:hypothetical protein